ncbi:MgtC/SapB family protein [Streptomyces sp. NPDC001978]|uniref:MgtC/SapB family protein n=1 Tax=Streptomyces sp. NPDC001978 TaxID=3364627 RepID=UPI0036AF4AD4
MTRLPVELEPLAVAFAMSSVIGIEREIRHKVAGLRTHALVGTGAAVFTLVSKYGFNDILSPGTVILNPGQLAGQIVTGVGFLGAGVIFVRRESARGIITAASIWVVAAVGMAAGARLYALAAAATLASLLSTVAYTPITNWIRRRQDVVAELSLTYRHGSGALRQAIAELTRQGCTVEALSVVPSTTALEDACVIMEVRGPRQMASLPTVLARIQGVVAVRMDLGFHEEEVP